MLPPISKIGCYTVERELGRGGMGVVYLGHDTKLDRPVAIKALPEEFAKDPERLARFEREARLLASLNHPNVAGIYGFEEQPEGVFLILELVEGPNLSDRLREGPIPVDEALDLAAQIAAGIAAAHEAGVVHRDLKPGNIKVTGDGQVKVLDFGLAKATAPETISSPDMSQSPTVAYTGTRMGLILGTAAYMSPEQARGRQVDRRTDLWALGCVLYEMLSGKQAFQGETISDTLAAVLRGEPDWALLPEKTPAAVRRLLRRCLEKDPRHRLRDASDALLELEEAQKEPPGTPISGFTAAQMIKGRVLNRWTLLLIGVAVVGALALGLALGRLSDAKVAMRNGGVKRLSMDVPPSLLLGATPTARSGSLFRFSPDGNTVAFIGRLKPQEGGDGNTAVYLRHLDSYELRPVPGTEGATGFLFTPDGRWMIVGIRPQGTTTRGTVVKVPVDGGSPPLVLTDLPPERGDALLLPGGEVLAFNGEGTAYWRFPIEGKPPAQPTKIDSGGFSGTLQLLEGLPGDRGVLLNAISYGGRGFTSSVAVLDLATSKLKIVVEEGGNPRYQQQGYLLFSRGPTLLAVPFDLADMAIRGAPVAVASGLRTGTIWDPGWFEISSTGTLAYLPGGLTGGQRRMVLLDAQGRPTPWSEDLRAYQGLVSLSADGRRLATVITNPEGIDEIWLSRFDQPSLARAIALPSVDCDFPIWSPDGRRLAYTRFGKDPEKDGIYVADAEGPGPGVRVMPITSILNDSQPFAFSADGKSLWVQRVSQELDKLEAVVVPIPAPGAPVAKLAPLFPGMKGYAFPALSPDGRLVAYTLRQSGHFEVWVGLYRPGAAPADTVRVGRIEGYRPLWSADSLTLYFFTDPRTLYASRLTPGAAGALPALSAPEKAVDLGAAATLSSFLHFAVRPLPGGGFLTVQRGSDEGDVSRLDLVLNWDRELLQKVAKAKP